MWSMDRLGDALGKELARFGPQAGMLELLERWPAAVGEAIARRAWPARIARDGTLHVNTSDSIWSFELGQQSAEIAERLGVPRLRFAPGPLPELEPPEAPSSGPDVQPADIVRAEAAARSIDDPELRESVQRAVSLGLAKARSDSPD